MSAPRKSPAQLRVQRSMNWVQTTLNSSMQIAMDCTDYEIPDVEMTDISSSDTEMNRLHEASCEYDISLVNSPIHIMPSPNISQGNSTNSTSSISLENPIIPTNVIQDIEMTDLSIINVSSPDEIPSDTSNDIRPAASPNASNVGSGNDIDRIHETSSDSDIRPAHSPVEIPSDTSSTNLSLEMAIKPSSTPIKNP